MRTADDARRDPQPGDGLAVTDEDGDMECRAVTRRSGARVLYRWGITPDDLFIMDQSYLHHGWAHWAATAEVLKVAQ